MDDYESVLDNYYLRSQKIKESKIWNKSPLSSLFNVRPVLMIFMFLVNRPHWKIGTAPEAIIVLFIQLLC